MYKRYDCEGLENHKSVVKKIHNKEKHLIKNTILLFLSAKDPAIGPIIAHAYQLSGVFFAAAIFSLASIFLIIYFPDVKNVKTSDNFQIF